MDRIGLALVVITIIALLVQGLSWMLSPRRPLSIGILNFTLALVTAMTAFELRSGDLVLAPEFGAMMVQGTAAVLILRLSLIAAATLPVLCWHRIRQLNEWQTHSWTFLVPGLLIGIWAATRVRTINPDDFLVLRVRMFDVWWPPLVIWLTLCLSAIIMALGKVESQITRFALWTAFTAPLARFALTHQELSDPQSRPIWKYAEWIALFFCAISILGVYILPHVQRRRWRILARAGAVVVFLVGGLIFAGTGSTVKTVLDLLPLVILALIFGLAQGVQASHAFLADLRRRLATSRLAAGSGQTIIHDFAIRRATGPLISLCLLVIPLVLADLLSLGALNRDLDIGILVLVWLSFSSRLAEGAFRAPKLFANGVLQLSALGVPAIARWSKAVFGQTRRAFAAAGRSVAGFFKGNGWAVAVRGIIGSVLVLMVLIAFGEMLQINRLVIEPLAWQGGDEDKDRVADRISQGVVNSLGEMRRELVPVLLVSAAANPKSGANSQVRSAVLDSDAMRAALAKNDDLKVGSFTIPVSVVTDPVQRIVRWLLGIHVVSGTIHRGPGNTYIILISSSPGDSWRVPGRDTMSSTVIATAPPAAQTTATGAESDPPDCERDTKTADPLDPIIDEVAFRIANNDPFFHSMGLTSSWPAYVYFRDGVRHWNCYEAESNSASLDGSIEDFRKAARLDPAFAPASYHLGLALESAGDLDAAIGAFQQTLANNPQFIQAEAAQAVALGIYSQPPNNVAAIAMTYTRPDRGAEARALWADLLGREALRGDVLDRSSAYYHLCGDTLSLDRPENGMINKFYLNYYYCSRAHALYLQMPAGNRSADEENQIEAYTLESLGDTLNYHDYHFLTLGPTQQAPNGALPTESWACNSGYYWLGEDGKTWTVNIPGSPLTAHALRYYRQSQALNPTDLQIRCNEAAATTYLRGVESRTMERLNGRTDAHMALASQFATDAVRARGAIGEPAYFEKAIEEYFAAFTQSPASPDALNGYAYTVWQWALDSDHTEMVRPTYLLPMAESYAREAVRLAQMQQDQTSAMNDQDTLGEVLIAEGRDEEAVEKIQTVVAGANGRQEGIDEERWDLAQALVCSSRRASPEQRGRELQEAMQQFTDIQNEEMRREMRPLTFTPGALDLQAAEARCFDPPDHFPVTSPVLYKLTKITSEAQPVCPGVVSVLSEFDGLPPSDKTAGIEILGEGDSRYAISSQRIDLYSPSHEPRRYFVRSVHAGIPASAFAPLNLPDEHDCAHGQVVLHFAALPAAAQPAATSAGGRQAASPGGR